MHRVVDIGTRDDGPRLLRSVPALDGLRGLAVISVLLHHAPLVVPAIFERFTRNAGLGVDAFFVLSGFLITALLLREQATTGRLRVGRFYVRRALRLLPALLLFLGAHAVYATVADLPAGGERSSLLAVLFYYANTDWHPAPFTEGIGHLWSLSVEEQFYLVWPPCVLLVAGLHRRAAVAIPAIVVAIAAVSVYRLVQWQDGADRLGLYQGTTTRADALLVGALLAHLWVRRLVPTARCAWAAWPALGFLTWAVVRGVSDDFLFQGGYTLVAAAVAVVILALVESSGPLVTLFGWSPLRLTGRLSYGIYIWHLGVFMAVARYAGDVSPGPRMALALVLTAAICAASWVLVEQPFLRWKHRLDSARAAPPSAPLGVAEPAPGFTAGVVGVAR